jgi:tol-pal system protein YbgF
LKRKIVSSLLRQASLVILAALIWSLPSPIYGVSKETLRMMQQLDDMQQQLQALQKTVDTQTAVLRTLIEQTNDKVTGMQAQIDDLKKSTQHDLEHDLAANGTRLDSMTSQIEALSASLEETKARLAKLSDQILQLQNTIQTLNGPQTPASPAPGATGGSTTSTPHSQPPDPDALLRSGDTYLTSGQYGLAIQTFQQYLDNYGTTDRALDAQYYIGQAYYAQGKYAQAVDAYNLCLERYPAGAKLPAAQLEKGYSLLALNEKTKGIKELRSLIQRFPTSHEAALARQKLRRLGVAAK